MAINPKPELNQRALFLNEEHEYIAMLFQLDDTRVFEEGSNFQFKMRAFVFLLMMFFFKYLFAIQVPSVITAVGIVVMCYIAVELLVRILGNFNRSLNNHGLLTLASFLMILTSFIVVISFVG